MDKVMKTEIEKILEELLRFGTSQLGTRTDIKQATSSLTALIIKWLEGKKLKFTDSEQGCGCGICNQIEVVNQAITELIGEVK